MKTPEDEEFDRILHMNALHEVYRLGQEIEATGQPYHWETDAIKAAVKIEREACARICEETGWNAANWCAKAIRARGKL